MSRSETDVAATPAQGRAVRDPLFSALIGVTSLVILLQGLWAGLFIREGKDFDATSAQSSWLEVHDWGARAAIVLALVSLIVAVVRLRSRRDLLVGTAILLVAVVLEAFLGGAIGDHPGLTALHIPLAMILMALSVWLPLRASRR